MLVVHRIDDLEKLIQRVQEPMVVVHRIDDLEKDQF